MSRGRRLRLPGVGLVHRWAALGPRFLPFADAATTELPLSRLLRLSLFQVSVGMATGLLVGTLNRVMIVEFGVHAWLVALMVSLPLVFAPFRALLGFKSDTHKSAFGWRRVPYIWMGSMLQFGGLSIMPFALLLLSGDHNGPAWVGSASAALAFLLVGAGMQIVQTAGLALAADLAPEPVRPRVVALMVTMQLVGLVGFGALFGLLLTDFTPTRLVQVVQGAAVLTMVLGIAAAWKQEARRPPAVRSGDEVAGFRATWARFASTGRTLRFMVTVGLGTAAFSMQDIILEPYGGEILHLSVGATTALTAMMAFGGLAAFAIGARRLHKGADPNGLAAVGVLVGLLAFCAVIFAEPLQSANLFRAGAVLIGFGFGLFVVGTLTFAMGLDKHGSNSINSSTESGRALNGLAVGAWGAVQATAAGVAIALGGAVRDGVSMLATQGSLGEALRSPATGYSFVYHFELLLLFATLIAIGPLVRRRGAALESKQSPAWRNDRAEAADAATPYAFTDQPPASQVAGAQENTMGTGAITSYVDVAQLVLYAFWIFFFGLIYYLIREGHREGYPMDTDRGVINGWPSVPPTKIYRLADGREMTSPQYKESPLPLNAVPSHRVAGAPLDPVGNPLLAGVGPGAWANRADVPDHDAEGHPKIQPLRSRVGYGVAVKDVDPRGMPVMGADGVVAGTVVDLWIDAAEMLFRYLEVRVASNGRTVLLPMTMARITRSRGVEVHAIYSEQFADVPGTRSEAVVTALEEEKIVAYYGAGLLYADDARAEPLL